jgi:frataxin-like iron-binding protein CyaY
LIQKSCFHSSQPVQQAVRRRRGSIPAHLDASDDSEGSIENPLKHIAVVNTESFCKAAEALLSKLEKALLPMKEKNDTFIITRSRGEFGEMLSIDLAPKEGSYRIEISEDEMLFQYTSPISGKIIYILSARTGEWVGLQDGHSFEGLLVRDLIRQCRGLPEL